MISPGSGFSNTTKGSIGSSFNLKLPLPCAGRASDFAVPGESRRQVRAPGE